MRTHYGVDLHDYYYLTVNGTELKTLNFSKYCHGHTYNTPKDNVVSYELAP